MVSPVINANSSLPVPIRLEMARRAAGFQPSMWDDFFIKLSLQKSAVDNSSSLERVEQLKASVKKMLQNSSDTVQTIDLIDLIQRVGVAYHFEIEIEKLLGKVHRSMTIDGDYLIGNFGLRETALCFRLLRQQGYAASSSDAFKNFVDEDGKWKTNLSGDVRGLLSLFEAAYFGIPGDEDNILDEALDFAKGKLVSMLPQMESTLKKQVELAIASPLRRCPIRLNIRQYISLYNEIKCQNQLVMELATLDFNFVQSLHQNELAAHSRWWKELGLVKELPFIRDRLVECYFWIMEMYYEPHYSKARNIITRIISLTSVIDDTYDVFGTFDEVQLFTDAIERWDMSAVHQLPEYMKSTYTALLRTVSEIEKQMVVEGRGYSVHYLKQAMKNLTKNYFNEAKWLHSGYVPKYEEYMKVAEWTSGYPMLTAVSYVGMSESAKEADFEWAMKMPNLIKAAATIARLENDIVGHKKEQERGHVASSVECYMKEHSECSEVEACARLRKIVDKSWKELNQESLRPNPVAAPLMARVFNLARFTHIIYNEHGDDYSHPRDETKTRISLVLVEPIPFSFPAKENV